MSRCFDLGCNGCEKCVDAYEPPNRRFYVWHGCGNCDAVDTLEEARELRDAYLEDGDYSVITNDRNETVR